jgi:hypothetical protein
LVEFRIHIHPKERQTYFPKILLEHLGPNVSVLPDNRSAIIYRTGDDLMVVAASVRILLQELELQIQWEKEERIVRAGVRAGPGVSVSRQQLAKIADDQQ